MTDTDNGRAIAQRVLASRRGIMCGVAALGAAGALAACGTAEPSDSSAGGSGDEPTGGTDSGAAEGGGAALTETSAVPVGGGIVVDDTIVVQPTADEFLAFSAACPHQGSILNAPDADGVIICPNHASQFDMGGELLQGPAETGLSEVDITVENGSITLA
ncbi:Rieske (2Fe-2S) protein [Glycomyces sp. L485]|uniref:Rieske (2Fe-2S) protein n=1 Tax=Glycomyces sp. L485 TaxID=2909235 RepID=UPI001F4BA98D|nr:Rieske (2Fe-2S) protein [Glycomyces sp. L485]MCH7232365.1 Rieske (2Fe-2S) protein [Glycomyces sp. L485]